MKKHKFFGKFFVLIRYFSKPVLVGVFGFLLLIPFFVLAQTKSDFGVAYSYNIIDESFEYGDIISYDKESGVYSLSKTISDANIFGVAVESPVLLFRSGEEGKTPIVQSGKALVNVTTRNGPIKTGDYITSSSIPGKGEKATGENVYVLGFALEPFGESATSASAGEVLSGKVTVMLNIEEKKDTSSGGGLNIPLFGSAKGVGLGTGSNDGGTGAGDGLSRSSIIKYAVAALITIASIFIALRNFMAVINKGITSVGRNPLAKSSVWSIVVFNTIIALVIGIIGIFLSLIIISLPF